MKSLLLTSLFFVAVSSATLSQDNLKKCPNYQYSCENCPSDSECIYPNSGGCIGAGVPICRKKNACRFMVCRILAQPCPAECPFDCQYNSNGCCPFAAKPVCKPKCLNKEECVETPCPDDCPDSCFYPNADFCCPKSGLPVCKK